MGMERCEKMLIQHVDSPGIHVNGGFQHLYVGQQRWKIMLENFPGNLVQAARLVFGHSPLITGRPVDTRRQKDNLVARDLPFGHIVLDYLGSGVYRISQIVLPRTDNNGPVSQVQPVKSTTDSQDRFLMLSILDLSARYLLDMPHVPDE